VPQTVGPQAPRSPERDTLIAVFVFNEGARVLKVLRGLQDRPANCDVLVMNDGSTDESATYFASFDYPVLSHAQNLGAGATVKDAVRYAMERGYRFIVMIAGNGKMDAAEIPRLIQPLLAGECDYVQGSRYLAGGEHQNLPLFRHVMIHAFTWVAWALTGFKGTDVTCGFRAYTLALFQDPNINIWQSWLDHYELEYYLHYKVIKLGYRMREVPVSMIYPRDGRPYSKIKPFVGWWSMIRPWVLLSLRIRR
jgi:dolichol-phosphate mannosyltransferase